MKFHSGDIVIHGLFLKGTNQLIAGPDGDGMWYLEWGVFADTFTSLIELNQYTNHFRYKLVSDIFQGVV